jgi:hypothetical protein
MQAGRGVRQFATNGLIQLIRELLEASKLEVQDTSNALGAIAVIAIIRS